MTVSRAIAELQQDGFCILPAHFPTALLEACRREALWPTLLGYIEAHETNRGPARHCIPMPFAPPCFAPEFFFDPAILTVARVLLGDRIVADQWSCDAPSFGSEHQQPHVDYARPLFPEFPDLQLPPYMLIVSFGLAPIALADGPIEIAPGTHRMPRAEALAAVESRAIPLVPIQLGLGDVLVRHPWALHRGTPNTTATPRALLTIRYVRRWYADSSREVNSIPQSVWRILSPEQRLLLSFPIEL